MRRRLRGVVAVAAGLAVAGLAALAGTWLGLPDGQVRLSALAGGVVIGIGSFLADQVKDFWEHRHSARERLDQVSGPAISPATLSQPGPASLLRPDRQIVGFIDRPELARLREWCDTAEQPPVLLLTGAGGTGKTRLALQLAREREGHGWVCRAITPGEEASMIPAVRAVNSGPVLLVADYAETRSGLTALLRAVSADNGGRLRVLLLARSTALPEADGASGIVAAAMAAFAAALKTPVPVQAELVVPSGPVPILVLHAAGLLAVLDSRDKQLPAPARVVEERQVLDDLLTRESVFWLGTARTEDLGGTGGSDSVLAAQAVTIGCLFAAADAEDASLTWPQAVCGA